VTRAPSDQTPFASVVVPVRNGERTIAACLDALIANDYPPERREILVVDNASTDRTAPLIASRPVTYLFEPRPGVSNARNRGIRAARGELVALLDGDCLPEPAWLSELLRPFEEPEVGCVAGELRHGPAATAAERQAERILGNWQRFAAGSDPPYVVTANAAFRRSVFDGIGLFDPRMTRAQDVELSLRFNELSPLRVAYRPQAVARHNHPATQLGFLRQQLGWAYGAGLVEAKRRAAGESANDPPRLRPLADQLRGLALVAAARLRREGRREYLEEAWFALLRQLGWWAGGWAGLVRGRGRFRDSRRPTAG
jgi:cellulose synthase/poly-beta-1,6-N-acetylglucosamine synthase-like glycosyltransferase